MCPRPNLFSIATKELSQDAFFTWLILFSNKKFEQEEPLLNKCAKDFVTTLIKTKYPSFNEQIKNVLAVRQWKNVDIVATINEKYFIVIEDKTYTKYHDEQLHRYREYASEHCSKNNLLEPILIYLKTGNESLHSLNNVVKDGYYIFDREKLISIFKDYKDIKDSIFSDFIINLSSINETYNQFLEKEIQKWGNDDWEGFHQFIDKNLNLNDINWGYANNPSNGFWWSCFSWLEWKYNSSIYMQLEQNKARLCFKVEIDSNNKEKSPSSLRNELYELITAEAKKAGVFEIKRPERFGSGAYMTFAIIEQQYWLGEGKLDAPKVIENILKYQKFFSQFQKKFISNA